MVATFFNTNHKYFFTNDLHKCHSVNFEWLKRIFIFNNRNKLKRHKL